MSCAIVQMQACLIVIAVLFAAKISLFYVVFYAVLGALFAFFSWVFFQTLDLRIPKWQLEESLIGTSPGLGFRPMPPGENVENILIWYKSNDPNNYKYWTDSLETFLEGKQIGIYFHSIWSQFDLKPI